MLFIPKPNTATMKNNSIRAIGLMSGTSIDGVDVAWLETDGERITH